MSSKFKLAGAITLILIGWAIVSTSDWHEEKKAVVKYCDMVEVGYWPDFKEIYATECKK